MKIIDMRPPRIGMVLFSTAGSVHLLLPSFDRVHFKAPVLGVLIGITGFALMMWAWWLFRNHKVAICPTALTTNLITIGPYSFSRNPMYLGMMLICVGVMLCFQSLMFYCSTLIYFCILNFIFIPYEEEKLLRGFENVFSDYSRRTRRWL
jgi:protein-S-isoprenylcysteine O-methyltransferase Ste14